MKRRSFFRALGALVAAVAIAPEIAFRQRLELPQISGSGCWEIVQYEVLLAELKRKKTAQAPLLYNFFISVRSQLPQPPESAENRWLVRRI